MESEDVSKPTWKTPAPTWASSLLPKPGACCQPLVLTVSAAPSLQSGRDSIREGRDLSCQNWASFLLHNHCRPLGSNALFELDFSALSQYLTTSTHRDLSRKIERLDMLIQTVPWSTLVPILLLPPTSLWGQEDSGKDQKCWTSGSEEEPQVEPTVDGWALAGKPTSPEYLCL